LTTDEASRILKQTKPGTFLLRFSSQESYFTISVRSVEGVGHWRILAELKKNEVLYRLEESYPSKYWRTVTQLIRSTGKFDGYTENSVRSHFPIEFPLKRALASTHYSPILTQCEFIGDRKAAESELKRRGELHPVYLVRLSNNPNCKYVISLYNSLNKGAEFEHFLIEQVTHSSSTPPNLFTSSRLEKDGTVSINEKTDNENYSNQQYQFFKVQTGQTWYQTIDSLLENDVITMGFLPYTEVSISPTDMET
jgi:hypothetical protein